MLEKPAIQDELISACLRDAYGVEAREVAFLPLGADQATAVYRVVAADRPAYFVKLRQGSFNETSVTLPSYLNAQGIATIIAPLATTTGQLWASMHTWRVILYPFVEGHNGYEVDLLAQHWRTFGAALKSIHTTELPPALLGCIRQETYPPQARQQVKRLLVKLEDRAGLDAVALQLATFLKAHSKQILDLLSRAERLAQQLQAQAPAFTLCHADLHAGNILIAADDRLYIVDWDDSILAPKERDLMFIGGGQGFSGHTAQAEARLFYQGYGESAINHVALAYYRYERIIQDIAAFAEQICLTAEDGADRVQALRYLTSNFLPGKTLAFAYASDPDLGYNPTDTPA